MKKNELSDKANIFLDFIKESIKEVDEPYFLVKATGQTQGKPKERVFCYELYYRLRLKIENNEKDKFLPARLVVNAESPKDKSTFKGETPDFIFHEQGSMDKNLVVVEVKGRINTKEIRKDFEKLRDFVNIYRYQIGIFILFSRSLNELKHKMKRELEEFASWSEANKIHVLTVKTPNEECSHDLLSCIWGAES